MDEIWRSFSENTYDILLEGNYKNFKSKRLIHLIWHDEISWEIYENNIAVITEWFKMADRLNLRIQHENGIEYKSFPSFKVYTLKLNSKIVNKLDYYIKFADISHELDWMEMLQDGIWHELFFYRDDELLNFSWATGSDPKYYKVAIKFCKYIEEKIIPKEIPFYLSESYGIEGELWYEPSEKQKLSSEAKEFLRSLIAASIWHNPSYNDISQKIGHKKEVMLSNSIDYNSFMIINKQAYKRGFRLTFKPLR